MDVSIVIVNYNSGKLLLKLLDSIYALTEDVSFEIIVVDNNSFKFENTKSELAKYQQIKILENDDNKGFAKAVNQGAKIAQGKYLFLLNPDVVLENNVLKILFDFMGKTSDSAVCGGMLKDVSGKYTLSFGKLPDINKTIAALLGIKNPKYKFMVDINKTQEAEQILGADFFVRKNIFDKLGGFSEKYFMYYEELEFCYNVLRQDSTNKIYYVPEAKMQHIGAACSDDEYLLRLYNKESAFKYYQATLTGKMRLFYLALLKVLLFLDFEFFKLMKANSQK